jgi:hypothetical protein
VKVGEFLNGDGYQLVVGSLVDGFCKDCLKIARKGEVKQMIGGRRSTKQQAISPINGCSMETRK